MKWLKRILTGFLLIILVIGMIALISFRTAKKSILEKLPGTSELAETSSGQIEYLIQGNSNKYIMLLHGSPGSYRTFNIQVLIDQGFSVISPSRPGYFRTPLSTGKSLEEEADAFAALLDELKIDSIAMIGFSGSGPVAIEFALRHQDRITDLVIISGIMEQVPEIEPNIMLKFMSTDFGSWFMSNIMPGKFEDPELKKEAKTYLRETLMPRSSVETGHMNDINHFATLRDFPFENIQCNTLVIHGTQDELIPYERNKELALRIPDSKVIPREDEDHFSVVFFDFGKSLEDAAAFIKSN